jgi:metal-responsive CopG/Arc/MetJ family transcriptional regulator
MSSVRVELRLDETLVRLLDERSARERRTRSAVVRAAVESYLHDEVEAEIDRQIIEGYERMPQTDQDLVW